MHQITQPRQQSGFSLVESMIVLLILAFTVTVALPAFASLAARNRIATELNSLSTYLQLARSEAIKRHHRAVLCSSADGNRCLGAGDWINGYMLFIDADADRERDPEEVVIQFRALNDDKIRLDAGSRKTVAYQPTGWAPGSNLTFTVCDPAGRAAPRAVVVSDTGRPRITDIRPDGSQLRCS